MLEKKTGIIFRSIKYGESSRILDVYCQSSGLASFIVSGVGAKRKGSVNPIMIRPFSIVEMVVYPPKSGGLSRIKEIRPAIIYQSIPFDLMKGSMATFMIEVASKTIKEKETNTPLYHFLERSFCALDEAEDNFFDRHLYFLLELSSFLGFEPNGFCHQATPFFDIKIGQFVASRPMHGYFLADEMAQILDKMLHHEERIVLQTRQRRILLDKLLDYYRYHVEGMQTILSHQVIKTIFE